jgi:peroxiredoxin
MVQTGDEAPNFTAPLANGEYGSFDLTKAVNDGPVLLAFFPAAFSQVCTAEMSKFQGRINELQEANVEVYGVSVDTPSALNAFREELNLSFDLISDNEKDVIDKYRVAMDFDAIGVKNIAKRAVFIIDEDGTIVYRWVGDDPGEHPEYDTIVNEAATV